MNTRIVGAWIVFLGSVVLASGGLMGCGGSPNPSGPTSQADDGRGDDPQALDDAGGPNADDDRQAHTPRSTDADAQATRGKHEEMVAIDIPESAKPEEVVERFLGAFCKAERGAIEALMTDKAREQTRRSQEYQVEPIASPDAKFQIGKAEYKDAKKRVVHVNVLWTDVDDQGSETTNEVIFALRRQANGWRVAGMAVPLPDTEELHFVNFEKDLDQELNRISEMNTSETETSSGEATPGDGETTAGRAPGGRDPVARQSDTKTGRSRR